MLDIGSMPYQIHEKKKLIWSLHTYLRDAGDDLGISEALVIAHVAEHGTSIQQESLQETSGQHQLEFYTFRYQMQSSH